jgi:hypothetical protein
MKYSFYFLLLFGLNLQAQNRVSETILLKTGIYIQRIFGLCQKFHPLVKTANLEINKAQSLMAARGLIQN